MRREAGSVGCEAAAALPSLDDGDVLLAGGDDLLQMVKLEGCHDDRERFLLVVGNRDRERDFCILGLDRFAEEDGLKIGLVLRLAWDVKITLDGDGGFSLRQLEKHLLFKPVSVQSLWTVYQTLHMVTERMCPAVGGEQQREGEWPSYEVTAPQTCINEWHLMADLLVKRSPSPDSLRKSLKGDAASAEETIKVRLRQIMKAADLDSITSKSIRRQLEDDLGGNLESFKSFIDKEILVTLGQMDPASQILDYLYLGSEWNASNLEELRQNGITHVLNATREIDNFFPAHFVYHNVREYDEEATDLLKYFDGTYKFIRAAREEGGRVLVHCKMGISRSASVTVSYLMKERGAPLDETLAHVRARRPIVKPNKSFFKQLQVYEGMLGAIRHRHSYGSGRMFRSKSESCVAPSEEDDCDGGEGGGGQANPADEAILIKPRVSIKELSSVFSRPFSDPVAIRPKSWSPNERTARVLLGSSANNNDDHDSDFGSEECRCFGDLARNCGIQTENHNQQNHHDPSETAEQDGGGTSSSLNNDRGFVEARNSFLAPPQKHPLPVNTSLYNPNCRCDMELELRVPDDPVLIDEAVPCEETEAVVQSMSSLPLRVRGSEEASRAAATQEEGSPPSPQVEGLRGEELSVRTLANLYDFKKASSTPSATSASGSNAARPCSVARLEDSRLFQKAKKLTSSVEADVGGGDKRSARKQSDC